MNTLNSKVNGNLGVDVGCRIAPVTAYRTEILLRCGEIYVLYAEKTINKSLGDFPKVRVAKH